MLTQARLKEVLSYDPETGLWIWLIRRRFSAGSPAGSVRKNGYIQIRVDGRIYLSGRLAFLYMTGEWPQAEIDHKDRDPANDRWENLREASRAQNGANRGTQVNNAVGVKGVCLDGHVKKRPYRAGIQVNGRNIHLGYFRTIEEARAAYAQAADLYYGEFARAA